LRRQLQGAPKHRQRAPKPNHLQERPKPNHPQKRWRAQRPKKTEHLQENRRWRGQGSPNPKHGMAKHQPLRQRTAKIHHTNWLEKAAVFLLQ
jgi:hypothetical protein